MNFPRMWMFQNSPSNGDFCDFCVNSNPHAGCSGFSLTNNLISDKNFIKHNIFSTNYKETSLTLHGKATSFLWEPVWSRNIPRAPHIDT